VVRLRELAKRVLPEPTVEWYRRRRALRNWLREVAHELYDRQAKLQVEELEGRLLARRPDITARLTKDLLSRMDLVLEQLDRKVEGMRARHGSELRALREEVARLREEVAALRRRADVPGALPVRDAEEAAAGPGAAASQG
jgi:hypothetical protein